MFGVVSSLTGRIDRPGSFSDGVSARRIVFSAIVQLFYMRRLYMVKNNTSVKCSSWSLKELFSIL